jgi:hypothetical protein
MLLSELAFGACMAYSVRGESDDAKRSRDWRSALKNEQLVGHPRRPMSQLFAQRLLARLEETRFRELLTRNAVLVPMPSSRLLKPNSLWVPHRLANALLAEGLGRDVQPCLERTVALPKSAWSDGDERPSAQRHYETLRARKLLFEPDEIVLVDDVVTRGATLIGAASRLHEALPNARISAFAAMRAISNPEEFRMLFDPCLGQIHVHPDGSTTRRP